MINRIYWLNLLKISNSVNSFGIFFCPFLGILNKLAFISNKYCCNLFLLWSFSVRILYQFNKHFYQIIGVKSRHPRVFYCFSTDFSSSIFDIRVIDFSFKFHIGTLEGIVVTKIKVHNKLSAFVRSARWSVYNYIPVSYLIVN